METILNNTARVYDFSFVVGDDTKTVKLNPGFNHIKPEEHSRIKGNPLFKYLREVGSIVVGSAPTGASVGLDMAEPGTVPVVAKKKKKVSTAANGVGDLEDFE